MVHNALHLLAALALLVQAVVGPAGHTRGVALCISLGACGPTVEVACGDRPKCCTGCSTESAESTSSSFVVLPAIALRSPCGGGCTDCVDLELDADPIHGSARGVGLAEALASITHGTSSIVALPVVLSVVISDHTPPRGRSDPPRPPAHALIVRAVRLRL